MTKTTEYDLLVNAAFLLGIDIGTSGIRACVIEPNQNKALAFFSVDLPLPERMGSMSEQDPLIWQSSLMACLQKVANSPFKNKIQACVLDATSSTVLLTDSGNQPVTKALMYDDKRAINEASIIAEKAPKNTAAHGASSTLAKVMWLNSQTQSLENPVIAHQIDFLNRFLCDSTDVPTDENNALKLGYDIENRCWPSWIEECCGLSLPTVVPPGSLIGKICSETVPFFEQTIALYAGTTDSIAAFLASGATNVGDCVTSLGSTIALKMISDTPIFAPEYGIYSHRLRNQWLVGGASNAGGAVLLKYFSVNELEVLIPQLNLDLPSGLDYYPLMSKGERFPIADAELEPRVSPIPEDKIQFLQGLIEGLTQIELMGYGKLSSLNAPSIQRIFTAGGGRKNAAWMRLRQQAINADFAEPLSSDAAFGVAQLIRQNFFVNRALA